MKNILSILLLLVVISCNKNVSPVANTSENTTNSEPMTEGESIQQSLIESNNQFTLELFNNVSSANENIIISPFSVSSALAMTYAGAKNNTQSQMSYVLHFNHNQEVLHADFSQLLSNIKALNSDENEVNIANSLWVQNKLKLKESYLKTVKTNYASDVQSVDFILESEKTRGTINKWVESKTNQKIKDLIPVGGITKSTMLVLTNAIYFLGTWENKFDVKNTIESIFYLNEESKVNAPFMRQTTKFKYFEDEFVQVIDLPYAKNKLSMMIVMPKEKFGLMKITKAMLNDNYTHILAGLQLQKVAVSLPKFKISSNFDLGAKLSEMGMPDAFTSAADFSGITGSKDLNISKIMHKAFIEVNEKGTEAAGATTVVMEKTSYVKTPVFTADSPFLYLIKDNISGSILFIGKIVNPVQ